MNGSNLVCIVVKTNIKLCTCTKFQIQIYITMYKLNKSFESFYNF